MAKLNSKKQNNYLFNEVKSLIGTKFRLTLPEQYYLYYRLNITMRDNKAGN